MIKFKHLKIKDWQQFIDVDIEFHDNVTILTGANGSGKTTILNYILARHCGWNLPLGSTPRKDKTTGIYKFFPSLKFWEKGTTEAGETVMGSLKYSNDEITNIQIPNYIENNPQYNIGFSTQQPVKCLFVPSQRSVFSYKSIDSVPTKKKNKQQAFSDFFSSVQQRYQGNNQQTTSMVMKSTLISWAVQGYGNQKIQSDEEQVQFFEGFEEKLRVILPKSLNFEKIELRNMEVIFVCNGGKDDFIFEQSSGGVCALIDIAWQIYMFSTKENGNFTAIIDEVENHLHLTMQRRVLTDLAEAFPHVSFIVSTHSPLVISSIKNSNVYAFRYDENGKVYSQKIDLVNEAKSANEILDEVLGVSFTMPVWAEKVLESLLEKYKNSNSPEKLKQMRQELNENGLGKLMPEAIDEVYK